MCSPPKHPHKHATALVKNTGSHNNTYLLEDSQRFVCENNSDFLMDKHCATQTMSHSLEITSDFLGISLRVMKINHKTEK